MSASCGGASGGAVCGPVNVAPGTVSGSVNALPAGGAVTITINATAPLTGPLVNTATGQCAPGRLGSGAWQQQRIGHDDDSASDLTVVKVANGTFTQGQVGASLHA